MLLNHTEYFIKHSGYALFYGEYLRLNMVLNTILANAHVFVYEDGYSLSENEKLHCDNIGVSYIVY